MISESEILIKFGERVRTFRKIKDISQEELAHRASLHRTYIGMIERAEKNITLLNIEKIANALEISISELCDLKMTRKGNDCNNQNDKFAHVSEAQADYGSKGEHWAKPFVKYMKSIVTHPIYEGMPDAVKDDGKIQWEAPSNRSGGKYQFTHQKRRDWWTNKAISIGVDPNSDKWISKTAKSIHPTGKTLQKMA